MQNDEYTPDLELDAEQNQDVEETTDEVVDNTNHEADEVDWKAEALKYKAILARKNKQPLKTEPKQQTLETNYLTREEGILIAKGMSEEELDQLKVIAKGKGVSLLEAEKDPLFVTYYEKLQKEKKSEQAKLGASKGSAFKETKPQFTSGLSREDHMKLWQETQ